MPVSHQNSFASLDLGSNSFHLLVVKQQQNTLEVVLRQGEKIQLAAGLDANNSLSQEAQQRGLACLKNFAQHLTNIPNKNLGIVATSTLRKAVNAQEFLTQAEQILNHKIKVISGEEEAQLVYQGAVLYTPATEKERLVLDIGGGSTEFILGKGKQPLQLYSLDMGCVSLTNKFFAASQTACINSYNLAYNFACQQIEPIKNQLLAANWHRVDGCSGTFKTLAEVHLADFSASELCLKKLALLKEMWLANTSDETWQQLGVRPERTHLIPAGIALCSAIFNQLNINQLSYADGALREGLLQLLIEGKNPCV